MTRLEELFVRWHDGQIEDAELRELNAALREPESRKQLMAAFQFHAELLQSLQSLRAVEQTAQSAHDFQTLELRDSEPFSSSQSRARSWFAGLKQLRPRLGIPALAYSFAAMVVAALTFFFFASSKRMAVLDGNIAGVTIVRGGQAFPGKAGFALRPGDRVKTSGDNNAFVRYVAEPTQIKLLAGTQLRLDQDTSGKHLEVLVGTISAKVAPQPAGHPMMVATPHSDAKIIGTEFVLTVDSASTHLEVIEGSVQLCNRE